MRPLQLSTCLFLACAAVLLPVVLLAQRAGDVPARRSLAHGAPGFIENRGQVVDDHGHARPDLLYTMRSRGVTLYLAGNSIHYVYIRPTARGAAWYRGDCRPAPGTFAGDTPEGYPHPDSPLVAVHRVDLEFVCANPDARVEALEGAPEYTNYYLGSCPGGITGVRTYRTVVYHELYRNIDLICRATDSGMKYDLVVRPGGNPNDIRLRYNGAGSVRRTSAGALRVENPLGFLDEGAPLAYQPEPGSTHRRAVQCRFTLHDTTAAFAVGAYDAARELVIDPAQEWATFYGGGGAPFFDIDFFSGGDVTEIDRSGNCLLIGNSFSALFPTTPGALRANLQGIIDAFVVKFDPYGNVIFATFYGGTNGDDYGHGVATDAAGNIFITGHTSSTDIPRAGAFQNAFAGGVLDAWLAKLSPAGTLLWGTYCGTAFWDDCYATAVDGAGNVYALLTTTGATLAAGAPVYKTPRNPAHPTGGGTTNNDLMVVKFNGGSGQPIWAKFTGGAAVEYGFSTAADTRNNILITGWTNSIDFPTTAGCAQGINGGGYDAIVAKIDSAGNTNWSTYYGGSGTEDHGLFPLPIVGDFGVSCLAVDFDGNAFVTGATTGGFPTTPGAWTRTAPGGIDAFLFKLDSGGAVRWATYIGAGGSDYGMGVAATRGGNVVVAGTTTANGLPTAGPGQDAAFQTTYNGGANDAFLARFNAAGAPTWITYFGGSGDDAGHGVSCDPAGATLLAGESNSAGAPFMLRSRHQVANAQALARPGNSGGYDAYLTLFCDADPPRLDSSGSHALCEGDTLRIWIPGGYDGVKWYRRDPPTYATATELTTFQGRDTLAIADSGRYYVAVESAQGCASLSADVIVVRSGRINPVIAPAGPVKLCTGDTVELSVGPGIFRLYRWQRTPALIETTPTMKVWAGGTYRVTVTNAIGCRDSAAIVVQEYPKPGPVTVTNDTILCAGDHAMLAASGGAGGTIAWYSTAGGTPLGGGAQYITDKPGSYYAVSTSGGGCSARSNTVIVTVRNRPRPKITAALPVAFCDGDSTILDVMPAAAGDAVLPGGNYVRYAWSGGETARRITVRDIPIGTRTFVVSVTDTNGCTADTSITVTKNARPKPHIIFSPDTVVCEGDSVTLSADASYASYQWNNGSTEARIRAGRSAAYVLAATTTDGCAGISDTVHVTVRPRPAAAIAGPVAACVNSSQQYSAIAAPGVRYAWQVVGPSGTITAGAGTNAIGVDWGAAGDNKVIVTVTDIATGCTAHDTLLVKVGSVLEPNITMSRSPRLCPGDSVVLDAGAGFASYLWSTGAGTRSITVKQAGRYTVTVANAGGCSGTSLPLVVTEVSAQVPVITPSRSLSLCPGDTVELDAGGPYADYLWSNGATIRRLKAAAGGTYQVTTVDTNGCSAASAPVQVVLNNPPQPAITGPNSACIGSTLSFRATGAPGDIYMWAARGPGAALATGQGTDSITVLCAAAGDDTIEVRVTSAATGCTGVARYVVNVGTSLKPAITTDRGTTALCAGTSLRLIAPNGYASYLWSPTGERTPAIVVSAAGTYSVTVRDAAGCSGSGEITVSEKPPFTVPVSTPDGTAFCPGKGVRLEAPPGFARYRWSPGGDTSASLWVVAAGTYIVTATDADGCTGASVPVAVTANRVPAITGIDQAGDMLTAMVDETNGPRVAGYQWLQDGQAVAGATASQFTASAIADYAVIVTSTDGCTATFGPVRPAAAASATVEAPVIAAAPGERVVLPLVMTASQNLDRSGARDFEARLRFNRTLLIPADATPSTIAGNDRVMTIRGTRSTGTVTGALMQLEFIAALGSDTATPLVLEGFRWLDTSNGSVQVVARDGIFRLLDVCSTGGRRLLTATGTAKIAVLRPNPTSGITEVEYEIIERGESELYVADEMGNRVVTLARGLLTPGLHAVQWNAAGVASGFYHCVLVTPSQRLTSVVSVVH